MSCVRRSKSLQKCRANDDDDEIYELIAFGRTSWTSDQPVARPLPTRYNTTQKTRTQELKYKQTSMPRTGFKPTIPVTKRPRLLDRAVTGTCLMLFKMRNYCCCSNEPDSFINVQVWLNRQSCFVRVSLSSLDVTLWSCFIILINISFQ
jgi:hypothetical protein